MIGIFDSGVGGLSVLRAIRARMPHADIVYFGDIEHAPYGNRSAKDIAELIAMALRRLAHEGATDIVSACNSASVSVRTVPIDLLRIHQFNMVEMVGPTVEALKSCPHPVAILGTVATIRSGMYQEACAQSDINAVAVAVPDLAGLIEAGASEHDLYVPVQAAVKAATEQGALTLCLSCTHYPFVKSLFERALAECGSSAAVFDPADAVAAEVAKRYEDRGEGSLRFLISQDSAVFRSQVASLFPEAAESVEVSGSIYWALKTP